MSATKTFFEKNSALFVALVLFLIPVLFIEYRVMHWTHGVFAYPLDDSFIHMAVAKSLAFHEVWGISGHEFESASSSLLYTLILAGAFKLLGASTVLPFVINLIAAVILLIVVRNWLQAQGVGRTGELLILAAVIFFTPLPILVISGMEHTLQCLFSFLLITRCASWVEEPDGPGGRRQKLPWPVYIYGMLVTMIRYEGMFLVACVCLLLLFRRRFLSAVQLGIVSLAPLFIFGLYSLSKGSYFFPNSVLLKSEPIPFSVHGILHLLSDSIFPKLTISTSGISAIATQRLLIILPIAYLLFIRPLKGNPAYRNILLILIPCTLLQLSFAATGWFYRYEAYLVFNSTVILGVLCWKYGRDIYRERIREVRWMAAFACLALFFPLLLRSTAAFQKASQACLNIYQQQYQMGSFLHQYYRDDVVGANDIGAVSYFTRAKNIDLWGLGNIDVAKSKKKNYWTPDFLDSLSRNQHMKVAIVYDSWFNHDLLRRWNKVATWQIQNNVICGDNIVSFYAVNPTDSDDLKRNLVEYEKQSLPAGVTVRYY